MPTIIDLVCEECGKDFQREKRQVSSSIAHGVKNYFCTRSCGVRYNNKHHGHGEHRSFIEKWLEGRIREKWPTLEVLFNDKTTVGSELDIYIPSLKLAIELHGKQHYLPIYGEQILENTQKNDAQKRQACKDAGIELVEVDMSKLNAYRRDPEFVKIVELVLGVLTERVKI